MASHTPAALRALLARENCAFYASEYLRGPPKPPFNGRFLTGNHHEAWADMLTTHKRLCVIASRGGGKCLTGDALVLRADGALIRHDEWTGGDVLAFDGTRFVSRPATAAESQGLRPCVRVETHDGRSMTVTLNHPLLVEGRGWIAAEHINVGDRIATPRALPVFGDKDFDGAWLLGLLIGDGSFHESSSPTVTSGDQELIFALTTEVERRGWQIASRGRYGFALIAPGTARTTRPKEWIRSLGLLGHTAYDKFIPSAIFTSSRRSIADFVAGYLDSDGHVKRAGSPAVEFYSVSETLLRGVQHLLMRLGISARLSPKRGRYAGEVHMSWRLTVRSHSLLRLAAEIRPRGKRGAQLREVARSLEARIKPEHHGVVLWDEVTELDFVGDEEVFAIHVPGLENYVANDVVQHNSHFFTHAYPIWMAEKNPGQSGFIFSASQPQADEILIRIMREVETNPKLAHLLPSHAKQGPVKSNKRWSAKTLEFSNGFTLQARGYGTKVRGAHPIFIACDDILNDETAYSETVRLKQNDYYFNAVTPMIMPGGQIVVVGTPLHACDLYGELRKNKEYIVRDFPAIGPGGDSFWPEVFPINVLHRTRDEVGAIRFSREFLCKPVTDLASLFPVTLFRGEPTEQFNVRMGVPLDHWQWRSIGIQEVFIGVDFAISSNIGSDYTVVFVIGVDRYGNRWVMDILREKGLEFTAQKGLINTAARKYRAGLIFAEANQMQRIFADELMKETDLPIKPFNTTGAKHTLENGLPAMRVLLENHKWRIPRGDAYSVALADLWISEMNSFTVSNGKVMSTGEHDDSAMASYICDQALRQGSFGFSFEEEPEDAQALADELALAEVEAEDPWNDGIPGGGAIMGGQPVVNARLVNTDDVNEDYDNPRNPHGDPKTRIVGYVRPGHEPVKDWRPKLGSPTAKDILNAIGYGRG